MRQTLIPIAIVIALCGAIEGVARLYEKLNPRSEIELEMFLQPYTMFTAHPSKGITWTDIIKNTQIKSTMAFNNYGYAEPFDYQVIPDAAYLERHGKRDGERIVLITGGSAVHGVGASKNQNTISAQLERHLNEKSKGTRYRVLNMGMGSWIAYQQFVGLSLFGLPFDPDWIVVMDGHNDGSAPCIHGNGAGNPYWWPKMLYLTYGGTGGRAINPTVEALTRHSAVVRLLSGSRPDERPKDARRLVLDDTDTDRYHTVKLAGVTIADQDRQLNFYLQAQRNVLALFNRANVLLSTQPLYRDNVVAPSYRAAFAPGGAVSDAVREELDRYMAAHGARGCDQHIKIDNYELLGYFMARGALRLVDFATEAQRADRTRRIVYQNVEAALPYDAKLRAQFFIDNVHFSDLGHGRVAEFFAENILAAERGTIFDFAAFAKRSAELAAEAH